MAVLHKLNGVSVTSNDLPIVTALVRNGIIGGFRPRVSVAATTDISNSGASITGTKGTPIWTPNSVVGDQADGLVASIPETMDLTMCAVYRMGIGTYTSGSAYGSYYTTRGPALMVTWGGSSCVARATAYIIRSDTSAGQRVHIDIPFITGGVPGPTKYVWAAMTINSASAEMSITVPSINAKNTINSTTTAYIGPNSFKTRPLVDPSSGAANYMNISCFPITASAYLATVEVAEALSYNRVLSDAEIVEQYGYSKSAMAAIGITI